MWSQLYGVCYCLSNSCAIVFRHNQRFDYRPQSQDRQKLHPLISRRSVRRRHYRLRIKSQKTARLVCRRFWGDMIEVYKNIHEHYDKDVTFHLQLNPYHRTRGHNKRLYKLAVSGARRWQFFSQRVIDHWNSLTDDIVNAPSLATFEKRLDAFGQI